MLSLLLAGAAAAPPPTWLQAWDALLTEALEGQPPREELRRLATTELPAGDPTLPLVQYWLGHAAWEAGDVEEAREALDACIRAGIDKARCLDLRSRIDLETDAVAVVPTRWTFDSSDHGFVHPRAYWDRGSIRLNPEDGGVLAWTTEIDPARDDQLVVAFRDPAPEPKVVTLTLVSLHLDARVALVFQDEDGREYVPPTRAWSLHRGERTTLTVRLAELAAALPGAPPLTGGRLHRMFLRDETGLTGQVGQNVLHIDEFVAQ